ncbi:MAG: hypothetical protein ACKN81_18495 [Pirellulaceae bacterium]
MLGSILVCIGLLAFTMPLADPPKSPPAGDGAASDLTAAEQSLKELQVARAEGYRVRAADIGPLGDMKSLLDFRPKIEIQGQNQTFGDFNNKQFADGQVFNNQNGGAAAGGFGNLSAGGGGKTFAGGGGATFSGGGLKPNVGIAFQIEPENPKGRKNSVLMRVAPKLKVTDLAGQVSQSEDNGPLRISYPQFLKQFDTTHAAYIYLPKAMETSIQKIEGELLVTPGRRVEVVFTSSAKQQKKADGAIFRLEGFQKSTEGIQIQITFPETKAIQQANDFFSKFQAFTASVPNYELSLEDDQGNQYLPTGKTSAGGSSGSSQSFSVNGKVQNQTNNTPAPSFSTLQFTFPPLPADRKITKIIAAMVEIEGDEKAIPFTIEAAGY